VKRARRLAIAWLLCGTVVPVAAAMAIFGCCELPLHGLVHRVVPLCEMATMALAHQGHDGGAPAAPAPSRPDPKPTMDRAWRGPERPSTRVSLTLAATLPPPATAPPSLRTLPIGAFRCDDDVGTRLASVETLRL